jgi:hypothetical protein
MAPPTYTFESRTSISQPILTYKPILDFLRLKINLIQNGVNIQDGDFTFIHPSV